ncbi:hypothetical protein [Mycolicibacterium doricum]|uniref:Uncharacterized protein n=1 Tax=Mycolicibacterium doricum TaxID=126673 RepID=A0A1X1T2W5_9MYCO|nr:hypothetical protein [Mycolicibacterium doricum]MCV7268659.1 hypothetical protein [Mycolicibacterium doricum]ORV38664.1 hypothetical protein AWC01_13975 [Mycolicibacterium doricum]
MLDALLAGETDPAAMAELAKKRMRVKVPQLTEARVSDPHAPGLDRPAHCGHLKSKSRQTRQRRKDDRGTVSPKL